MAGANPCGRASAEVSRELAAKVAAFIRERGLRNAGKALGLGAATLETARDRGRLRADTLARLVAALDAATA